MRIESFLHSTVSLKELVEIDQKVFGSTSWDEGNFDQQRPLKKEFSQVATDKESLVGYLVAYRVQEGIVHVSRIGLREESRGNGVGTLLLEAFLRDAALYNMKQVTVEHAVELKVSQFYISNGFTQLKGDDLESFVERMGKAEPNLYRKGQRLVYQLKLS